MVLSLRRTVSKAELRIRFGNSNIVRTPVSFGLNECVKAIMKKFETGPIFILIFLKSRVKIYYQKTD